MRPMKPYSGLERKLVIALDVGTTFSGVSYALMELGKVPQPQPVTRFPAQDHVGGDAKIPSILYYDPQGQSRAIGAEALQETIIEQAEDEDWVKIEWFKLHRDLRPKGLDTSRLRDLPLPEGKTISYIEDTYGNGQTLWRSLSAEIEYIITHPNGWKSPQQAHLRRAAVEAGLVPDGPHGQGRIQFLTEGEASLHFCVQKGLVSDVIETPGQGITIVDAGGGTIDVSAFAPLGSQSFEEISVAQCHLYGSVFVTRHAKDFLQEKFSGTKFAQDVNHMAEVFDRTTKLRFRDENDPAHIRFGGAQDKDPALKIRAGQLQLQGSEVVTFFRPSIDCIIQAIFTQHENSHKPISNVLLVGGFAASDFVFTTVKKALEPDIILNRPDGHTNKAVADGAIWFYLERLVSVRVSCYNFGVKCNTQYDPSTMRSRAHLVYNNLEGTAMVPDYFDAILLKGTQVSATESFVHLFVKRDRNPHLLDGVDVEIRSYRGNLNPCPTWLDSDRDNFTTHCKITGNLSEVPKLCKRGPSGHYYEVEYSVNITFGPAELEAYISWKENSEEKCGPIQIIEDEEG